MEMVRNHPDRTTAPQLPVLICFLLALLVHGLWMSLSLRSPQAAAPPSPPQVTAYFRELPGGWSPTLFSLPSPAGFSGAMRENAVRTAPPLQSPLALTESIRLPLPDQEWFLRESGAIPRPDTALQTVQFPFTPPAVTVEEGWSLRFPDYPELEVRLSRLPGQTPERLPFGLTGEMSFDASGRLTSLVVDPSPQQDPLLPGVNRVLRRVRVPEATPEERMRFRFWYTPTGGRL